jgi:hypothetical protein
MVYKGLSGVMLPRMRELSPASTLVASNKTKLLFEYFSQNRKLES